MKQFKIAAIVLAVSLILAGSMFAVQGKDTKKKKRVETSDHGIAIKMDLSGLTKGLEKLKDLDLKGLDKLDGLGDKLEAMGKELENLDLGALGDIDIQLDGLDALDALGDIDIHLDGLEGLDALGDIDIQLDGLGNILENSLKVLDNLDLDFDFHFDFDGEDRIIKKRVKKKVEKKVKK